MTREYGAMLREERERNGFGLRQFAEIIGVKPSNLSDIETNKKLPYFTPEQHEEILNHLGIQKHSKKWYLFFDAARKSCTLPRDVERTALRSEKAIISLLRTIDRLQLSEKQIRELVEHINKEIGGT